MKRTWPWLLVVVAVVISGYPIARMLSAERPLISTTRSRQKESGAVSCLGRIEPEGGLIHVAGSYILGHPPVIERVAVREGDNVRRGAVLALLSGQEQLGAALEQAKAQTAVAKARLDQVRAGVRKADLAAQQSEIARIEAKMESAQAEFRRYDVLRKSDDVTASELDARRAGAIVAERELEESRRRLQSLEEVPASDVKLAEAQLEASAAAEMRAQRELEMTVVRAPVDGRILKIHSHPGEEAQSEGILDLRQAGPMYVIAEVYETDIPRVRPGQRATISGDLLATPLNGTVQLIGSTVRAAAVIPGDPASFSDARIVEVKIRLDQQEPAASLINGKVTVVIQQ
ncbi:MAG TPA: efflux RND transporter periplasmic adaptor subunit [Bryobacteraceae bacterium]|nr:efflux RND transporter periplasmic adaptor subunit [Bryobacteraceae bacterium]